MIEIQTIGWWNTGFPLVVLAAAAVLVPWVLVPKATRSQRAGALGIAVSAMVLFALGVGVFIVGYATQLDRLWSVFADAPLAALSYFVGLSAYSAILWAPILAIMWFGMAQSVERRKGADVTRSSVN